MIKRTLVPLAALALLLTVSPAASAVSRASGSTFTPQVGSASDLPAIGHSRGSGGYDGYLPLNPSEYARLKAAADPKAASSSSSTGQTPALATPSNVSPSFGGIYDTGATPPDANGAIGPTKYMETVNDKFATYGRTGSLVGSGTLTQLTAIRNHSLSDPEVKYDTGTGRFYYSAVYFDPLFLSSNGLAFGFSKTSSPKGPKAFCKYYVSFGTDLPDYPKLGDSSDFLLIGFNQFSQSEAYEGSQVFWVDKPPVGTTCPAASSFGFGFSGFMHNADTGNTPMATPVPADLVDDPNHTGYVVGNADLTSDPYKSGASFLTLYTVTNTGGSAVFNGPSQITVPFYKMPPNAPQKGTSAVLDTLDGRLEAATAAIDPHNGGIAIWTADAVASTDGNRSEERWYEIDPTTHSLFQNDTVGDPNLFVWNGAVAPDRNGVSGTFGGDMAMSVNTSSSSTYPAIQFVWKTATETNQSALTLLVQSAGVDQDQSCNPCRWGDYSGATSDPAATGSGKVWLTNQYNVASATSNDVDWRSWNFGVTPT